MSTGLVPPSDSGGGGGGVAKSVKGDDKEAWDSGRIRVWG
jgi:hypothetical protein